MTDTKSNSDKLAAIMVEAIKEKKGHNIKVINLKKLGNAVTDYFVICEAESSPQINAIYDSIDEMVKKQMNEDAIHIEGREELNWILMDYGNVVANIFKPETRNFYRLEALWADGEIKEY